MSIYNNFRRLFFELRGQYRQSYIYVTAIPTNNSSKVSSQYFKDLRRKYCSQQEENYIKCGNIGVKDIGKTISIRGFLQYQRLGFIVIRDSSGLIQVLTNDCDVLNNLKDVTYESYLTATGIVIARPSNNINENMKTGTIEIEATKLSVINKAKSQLPFLIRNENVPIEMQAMKYRYLHLRYPEMQEKLRLRSKMNKKMRDYLQDVEDFVEITTPTLSANTPGGAQEFVVPTRTKGQYYSLVQSPQTFKQLIVIGGFEKYFQFAVCYRDESTRPDRQPEFMQLDIEMANATPNGMKQLMENIIDHSWPENLPSPKFPFPSMDYQEAFSSYGCDKPDTRFQWKIEDVSNVIRNSGSVLFSESLDLPNSSARAFLVPEGEKHLSNKVVKEWNKLVQQDFNLKGISVLHVKEDFSLRGAASKAFEKNSAQDLVHKMGATPGDSILLAVGRTNKILSCLGHFRLRAADLLELSGVEVRNPKDLKFLWVENFPLFEWDEEGSQLTSCHHPFTAPKPQHINILHQKPLEATSLHYDLILNGVEIAGGSVRIHDPKLQREILDLLSIEPQKLSFLLEALECGAPPHGGIAMGFDRYLSMLVGAKSIREVIAFPKSTTGRCSMTGCPSPITDTEKQIYFL